MLTCWRNTEVENAHADPSLGLTNVKLAQLTIATTRALEPHITGDRFDWEAITAVFLDGHRRGPDGRTVKTILGDYWPGYRQDAAAQLAEWEYLLGRCGSSAAMRALALAGSSVYTERWYGHDWWMGLVGPIFKAVVAARPELLADESANFMEMRAYFRPDQLSEELFGFLLSPPDGQQGLRTALLVLPGPVPLGFDQDGHLIRVDTVAP